MRRFMGRARQIGGGRAENHRLQETCRIDDREEGGERRAPWQKLGQQRSVKGLQALGKEHFL